MAEDMPAGVPDVKVFVGDSSGRLNVLFTKSKRYEQVDVPGWRYGAAVACQKLVYGTVVSKNDTSWPMVS